MPIFLLLPLIEIAGFIVIGGELGLGLSFVWLIGAAWLGFFLLEKRGRTAIVRARKAAGDEIFAAEDLFDGVCIFIAAILLIIPGFISDFIAIPFLIGPLRHSLRQVLKKNPNGFAGRTFRRTSTITIEGEFRRNDTDRDGNSHNPPQ